MTHQKTNSRDTFALQLCFEPYHYIQLYNYLQLYKIIYNYLIIMYNFTRKEINCYRFPECGNLYIDTT